MGNRFNIYNHHTPLDLYNISSGGNKKVVQYQLSIRTSHCQIYSHNDVCHRGPVGNHGNILANGGGKVLEDKVL